MVRTSIDMQKLSEIKNCVGVALEVYDNGRHAMTADGKIKNLDFADIDLLHLYLINRARWADLGIQNEEDARARVESFLSSRAGLVQL